MTDAEGVVLTLGACRKGREPIGLLDGVQESATPGQHLVRIGLVAHIPNQPVIRRIEDVVQRDRQFHGAQTGSEMAAARAYAMDQELAQLGGQIGKLSGRPAA